MRLNALIKAQLIDLRRNLNLLMLPMVIIVLTLLYATAAVALVIYQESPVRPPLLLAGFVLAWP